MNRVAILASLVTAAALAGSLAAGRPGLPGCSVPQGWAAVAARKPRFVVFGETHGTREAPAFVGATACGLAARGERILVGIEQQATDDAALQAAWALPHADFPAALRRTGWAGRQDGVASEAMFALLVRLHLLKTQGKRIDVVAFNGTRDAQQRERFAALPAQGPHEAAQADNIRQAAERRRYDHVLVLVGNLHARKQPVTQSDVRFEPMAMRLAAAGTVISLRMENAPGTMWNCLLKPAFAGRAPQDMPAEAIDCGSHPAGGLPDLHRPPFVALGALPAGGDDDGAYDGYFWVGPISAAPPAVPGR